jgi:iron complex transport system substrate-binding protein
MTLTRRAAAAGLLAAGAASPAHASPRRVVSLVPCIDAILVRVADPEQITALSRWSREPHGSTIAGMARRFPSTGGSAEEIVALDPDLVLTSRYGFLPSARALARLDLRAEAFGVPSNMEESLAEVTRVAELVGHPERGGALNARIRGAVAAAAPPPGAPRLSALGFQANGFASAPGTLMDEMMRRAGFENAAVRYGLQRTGNVPLELVIADPPDVLLAGQRRPGTPDWAERVMGHPALKRVSDRMHRAVFPQKLLYCGGPVLIETVATLARARREALAKRA